MKVFQAIVLILAAAAMDASAQRNRIIKPIDNSERATLSGHINSKATTANDRGRVAASLQMSWVTLTLAKTAAQQADLDNLLSAQQTPGSQDYHRWLTPEQYADRFGVSRADLDQINSWLQAQGLTVAAVARGRSWVAANGTASQIEAAFRTEIHQYEVNGDTHFANANEPSIPTALASVVAGIRGLDDFRARPHKRAPHYTSESVCGGNCLAPDDLATIYDITPAYNAGMNGTGQTIAIAGQTAINVSDIHTFRGTYNLPVNDPQTILIPNSRNPGIINTNADDELAEADLDLEWSGAVARNATILYVYSTDVMQSVMYAIDNDLAPVVSSSYGSCELENSRSEMAAFQTWAQQGNAMGITWFNASGDDGAADCNDAQNPGLAVDAPASVPEITAIGGTEFLEGSGAYWSATNNANGASALSYIPETSWNDSVADQTPSASGGGVSVVFSQPSWQTGHPGVPGDGFRHVPDVAMTSSADHDGYLVYTAGQTQVYGGTSVPTPVYAGVAALINQYLVSTGKQSAPGLGNANPQLYSLAETNPAIFHDITTGNNSVSVCAHGSRNCNTVAGYNAGPGYDSVTGLGSVDVWGLITAWSGAGTVAAPSSSNVSLTLTMNLTSMSAADTVFLTATASNSDGAAPVGAITFTDGTVSLGSVTLVGSGGVSTATLALHGTQLPLGSQTITATWNGNSTTAASSVSLNVAATGTSSNGTPAITGLTNAASFQQSFAPGMLLTVFGSSLAPSPVSATSVPLPTTLAGVAVTLNGQSVPLLFVSPGQLNVQVPYETPVGAPVTLEVNNNGQVTSTSFFLAAAAPGIFYVPQSGTIANGLASGVAPGQTTTLYLTGAGSVSPVIADAAAPASTTALNALPAPSANVTVTVGGITSPSPLPFVGITPGLVGVVQINFEVPASVPAGTQPVIVTVGGKASAPASLVVTK
jgi:uncharacterized protein (TIGR03437 family)